MLRNLEDAWGWIKELDAKVSRIFSGAFLENSSITNGRMRFIGGLLRVDSGGRVEIVGTLEIDGTTTVTGQFTVTGPWRLTGNGEITGNVTQTGNWTITGAGKLTVGNMVIDPSDGGSVSFPGGAKVQADPAGGVRLVQGLNRAYVGPNAVTLQYGTDKSISLGNSGIRAQGVESTTVTQGLEWMGIDSSGKLWSVPPGAGGPMGGPLMWPFPPATVSDEFGPREPGSPGSAFHNGIDFAVAEGTPIPAAAAGRVTLAGWNGDFGNCVIVDHGGTPNLKTLYAHLSTAPVVAVDDLVSKGQTLGPVGNTGASYGAHLHFEVHMDGAPVNPRSKLPTPA